jgi:hypothetical protein
VAVGLSLDHVNELVDREISSQAVDPGPLNPVDNLGSWSLNPRSSDIRRHEE